MPDNLDKFNQHLSEVNFDAAERSNLETDIVRAISRTQSRKFPPPPIAPLADPVNLDELVGDNLAWSVSGIRDLATDIDKIYSDLADLNNTYMTEIESAEKIIQITSDAVQNVTSLTQDQAKNYLWVSDSFNDYTWIDTAKTSALVDTDIGSVLLSPLSQTNVDNVSLDFTKQSTNGLPGCNMLVLDSKSSTTVDTEPSPTLEKSEVKDISNLTDSNNQTWFEIERNLIPQIQPLRRAGRALVYDIGSPKLDVLKETANFDWKFTVTYPDGTVDSGKDGNGVSEAEFLAVDIDPTKSTIYDVKAEMRMNLVEPQPLSDIKIIPFVRASQGQVFLEKLDIVCDGQTITIAKNVDLTIQTSPTQSLQKEILRRTGSSSIGSVFTVPTNRNVTSVVISLVGKPYKSNTGLAHKFKEEYIEQRTERHYLIAASVSHSSYWIRKPSAEGLGNIIVSSRTTNLLGSTQPFFNSIFQLGGGVNGLVTQYDKNGLPVFKSNPGIQNVLTSAGNTLGTIKGLGSLGSAIGSAGTWLTKALPVIGAGLLINDVITQGFAVNTTKTPIKDATGYDIFDGWRSYIAIRDINLSRTIYNQQSEVISLKRQFSAPVNKVGLIVDYDVPSDWGQGDWVTFYLSTDGSNWTSVSPLSDTTLEQSFTPTSPTQDIFFRAVLKGNANDSFRSVALKNYTLQGLAA